MFYSSFSSLYLNNFWHCSPNPPIQRIAKYYKKQKNRIENKENNKFAIISDLFIIVTAPYEYCI